jgi:hypothetical protein
MQGLWCGEKLPFSPAGLARGSHHTILRVVPAASHLQRYDSLWNPVNFGYSEFTFVRLEYQRPGILQTQKVLLHTKCTASHLPHSNLL